MKKKIIVNYRERTNDHDYSSSKMFENFFSFQETLKILKRTALTILEDQIYGAVLLLNIQNNNKKKLVVKCRKNIVKIFRIM